MGIVELFLIAVGLSMDAFAVSVCKGLSTRQLKPKHYLIIGAWFGGFQALMPAIGYLLGSTFEKYITRYDHWVAFVLLSFIGGNMLKEDVWYCRLYWNRTGSADHSGRSVQAGIPWI